MDIAREEAGGVSLAPRQRPGQENAAIDLPVDDLVALQRLDPTTKEGDALEALGIGTPDRLVAHDIDAGTQRCRIAQRGVGQPGRLVLDIEERIGPVAGAGISAKLPFIRKAHLAEVGVLLTQLEW